MGRQFISSITIPKHNESCSPASLRSGDGAAQRFPTLYVHDGGEYLTRARLATVLDNLLHSREIPPLIAVMVDPVDRAREYWANEDYGRFTEEELLPYIDEHYRTLAQREARA